MTINFDSLVFVQSCTSFKMEAPTELPRYHPTEVSVGHLGCVGIVKCPEGGFDILGEDGQHFWVADSNVRWGRKSAVLEPEPEPEPEPKVEVPVPSEPDEPNSVKATSVSAVKMPEPEEVQMARAIRTRTAKRRKK